METNSHQWHYMKAMKNPLTGHWLITDARKPGLAFYVKSERAALDVIKFVKKNTNGQ